MGEGNETMGEGNEVTGEENGMMGGKGNGTKKGPRNVVDVPWATGNFFFLTQFIFILLTMFFRYYFKLLVTTTTTKRPSPLACEQLAHRVDCGDNKTTRRRETEKWRGPPTPSPMSNCSWGG